MSTLTTIQPTDLITDSRAGINNNFATLNNEKLETSVLDIDTTLVADSDDKIATQKATKAYVDNNIGITTSSEVTAATTHSLTTTASQKVIVIAKGNLTNVGDAGLQTVTLAYNGVTKDTVGIAVDTDGIANLKVPFTLVYTEAPGAATANITVATTGATLENVVILVQKIRI